MSVRTSDLRAVAKAGATAGLIGGLLIDLYLLGSMAAESPSLSAAVTGLYQFVAAGAVGKQLAFSNPAFAWLGFVLHFIVSIAWATGFAYLAQTRTELVRRPFVSGLAFGLVVWFLMQAVLIGAGLFANPTPPAFAHGIVSHCVFFGLPVAYAVAKMYRSR